MMNNIYQLKGEKVLLHGIFQKSHMVGESLVAGGHKGGQVSFPIAVVEFIDNGQVVEVYPVELKKLKEKVSHTKIKDKESLENE